MVIQEEENDNEEKRTTLSQTGLAPTRIETNVAGAVESVRRGSHWCARPLRLKEVGGLEMAITRLYTLPIMPG